MGDTHVTDLSAGYALGALTPHERELVDGHIAGCIECRADVMALLGVAGTLPLACDQQTTPAGLKSRILNAAATDVRAQQTLSRRSAEAPSLAQAQAARGGVHAAWGWLAGTAAAAAVLLGVIAARESQERVALQGQVESLQVQAESGHAVMTALASGTYWTSGPHPDANGKMWRCALLQPPARGRNGMLLASVPDPPRGMAYQVWLKRKGAAHKAGMVVHGGMTMMDMPMPLEKGDVVAFSVEPMAGSEKPTSPYMMQLAI